MKKVYVVISGEDNNGGDVVGVFKNANRARAHVKARFPKHMGWRLESADASHLDRFRRLA